MWSREQWFDRRQRGVKEKMISILDSKGHGADMRTTWALLAPDGPHVGPMNRGIKDKIWLLKIHQVQTTLSSYLASWWPMVLVCMALTYARGSAKTASNHKPYTPFAKSNGRFFSDTKINMMLSSNLYDFWWVHKMYVTVHFMCKIYWPVASTRSAPGF